MKKILILASTICLSWINLDNKNENLDYRIYHKKVVKAEKFIASENYGAALVEYEFLFQNYDFVFLREYQIASQISLFLNDTGKSKEFVLRGIEAGWELKSIRNNQFLRPIYKGKNAKIIKEQYSNLRGKYNSRLDQNLRTRVRKMFSKDQRKAFAALFKISSNAQSIYAEEKFAPHSERQLAQFKEIIMEYGYPGEKLIGNEFWMSTILSHHNSISTNYNRFDTIYPNIKPLLLKKLKEGEISPFELVTIDEWYRLTVNDPEKVSFGIINTPLKKDLKIIEALRTEHFIRTIKTHNKLLNIQIKTGLNFYLEGHPWSGEEIKIQD